MPCGNVLAFEGCDLEPACALALPKDHPAVVSARATLSLRRRRSDAGAYSACGKAFDDNLIAASLDRAFHQDGSVTDPRHIGDISVTSSLPSQRWRRTEPDDRLQTREFRSWRERGRGPD